MAQGRITAKQQEILEYIKETILKKGYPPAVREICEAVKLKSTSSVHSHLETLEKNGYIRRDPTKPRTIEIIDECFNLSRREVVNVPLVGTVEMCIRDRYYCDGTCRLEREETDGTENETAEGNTGDGSLETETSGTIAALPSGETSAVTVEAYSNQTAPETFPAGGSVETAADSSADLAETTAKSAADHVETTAETAADHVETTAESEVDHGETSAGAAGGSEDVYKRQK